MRKVNEIIRTQAQTEFKSKRQQTIRKTLQKKANNNNKNFEEYLLMFRLN